MLVDYLAAQGYDTLPCDGGPALRALFAAGPAPDCVILDLVMPGEDGLSVLRWLRADSDLPVIMLTSNDTSIDRVVGLELGADDYVAKPADLRELLARVRSVLRRRPAGPASSGAPSPAAPAKAAAPVVAASGDAWFGRWRLDRARRRLAQSGPASK